jgi:hypothetical protein
MKLVKMGQRVRSAKRGAHGPTPARKNRLWDSAAARKGRLVVTIPAMGVTVSTDAGESQEALGHYADIRQIQAEERAREFGIDLGTSRGRRWLARYRAGVHEKWVKAMTPEVR